MTIRTVVFMVMALMMTSTVIAAVELPEWFPGYWWSIQTRLSVTGQDAGNANQVDMVFVDDAPRYTCIGTAKRSLTRGSQQKYDVYELQFSGTLTGKGTAKMDGLGSNIPVELRNGTHVGETWVDINTLGTVYSTRRITGDLWIYTLLSWRHVGDLTVELTEEYEPPRDVLNFPVAVGNRWTDSITLYYYGYYEANYDLGFVADTLTDSFDDSQTFELEFNVVGTDMFKSWQTYRIEGADPVWNGQFIARYADSAKHLASFSMTDIEAPEQRFTIHELAMELTGCNTDAIPPPTPDPSRSGVMLHLSKSYLMPEDLFRLSCTVVNAGAEKAVDLFVILDVYQNYWFWPDWSESLAFATRTLDSKSVYPDEVLLMFTWPYVEGVAHDLRFWGAMLYHSTLEIFGDYDVISWGYGESPGS